MQRLQTIGKGQLGSPNEAQSNASSTSSGTCAWTAPGLSSSARDIGVHLCANMTPSLAFLPFTIIPTVSQTAWAVVVYVCIRATLAFVEWLRVHHLFSKLPVRLPMSNLFLGNLIPATAKGFHRWHKANGEKYGGIYANR